MVVCVQAIGYMAGQFAEQLQDICTAFRENLARVAAGVPPQTPVTDGRVTNKGAPAAGSDDGGGGNNGRLAPFAFDVAAVTGVGNELPGQSAFGRSLLVRQLASAFRSQCTDSVDSNAVRFIAHRAPAVFSRACHVWRTARVGLPAGVMAPTRFCWQRDGCVSVRACARARARVCVRACVAF